MRSLALVLAAAAGCTAVDLDTAATAQPVVGAELATDDPGVVALVTSQGRCSAPARWSRPSRC